MGKIYLALRIVGAALGWALFFYWWALVLHSPGGSNTHIELSALVLVLVIVLVVCGALLWIQHNRNLARKGRRGEVSRYVTPKFERDYFGRALALPSRMVLLRSAVVNLRIVAHRKIYSKGAPPVEPGRKVHGTAVEEVATS